MSSDGECTRRSLDWPRIPLVRARHLALSKDQPDADVAAVLDDAARLAVERGAVAAAAELAERALRLTPRMTPRRAAAARWLRRAPTISPASGRAPRPWRPTCWWQSEIGSWRAEALILLAELRVDRVAELLHRGPDGDDLTGTSVGDPLPSRLGDPLRAGIRPRRAPRSSSLSGWTTPGCERVPVPSGDPRLVRRQGADYERSDRAHPAAADVPGRRAAGAGGDAGDREHPRGRLDERPGTRPARAGVRRVARARRAAKRSRARGASPGSSSGPGAGSSLPSTPPARYEISSQYGREVPQDHLPIAVIAVHQRSARGGA